MTRPPVALPDADAPVLGRSEHRSGHCHGGPDGPGHAGASCRVVSWSPDPAGWRVCRCECHDVDVEDPELVRQVIAEVAPGELRWRLEAAGGRRRRRAG